MKVIEDTIMQGENISLSGYLEMAKNGPKGPKIKKNGHFSHSISMKYIVVSPKTLPTYIIVKTIAETYFEKPRYPKWHPFCENLAQKCWFL